MTRLGKEIKKDWGTVRHFCIKHDISPRTYNTVIYGYGVSRRVRDIMIEAGYWQYVDSQVRARYKQEAS